MLAECPEAPALDFGELFAGQGAVRRAMRDLGYRGKACDREYCRDHNMLQPMGMLQAVRIACSIRPGGVLWMAPPCSSWVWIHWGTTGRHFAATGDTTCPEVVQQNALAERVVLLMEILRARGAHYINEQPASSKLWEYPAMEACLRRHGLRGPCKLDMGAYGGSSTKATHLWGTAPYLMGLARRCDPALCEALQDKGVKTSRSWVGNGGKRRCCGTSDLKGTQAYPEGWGKAHAEAFATYYGPAPCSSSSSRPEEHVQVIQGLQLPGFADAWWLRDFVGEPLQ